MELKVQTDRTVPSNKPDIIIRNNEKGTCMLIDFVIQKIREQHTGKTRSQGTKENSHIGHCTHTAGSTDVKVH